MYKQRINRRGFLYLSAMSMASVVAACSNATATLAPTAAPTQSPATLPPSNTQPGPTPTTASKYSEAPMLADKVKAGTLPPVGQRLPTEPLVVTPTSGVGQYGGTLRFGDLDANDLSSLRNIRTHGLFHYNQTATDVVLDVAKSYQFSTDLTTLTLEIREGHKWSDGQPFTVDDFLFWWEDIQLNKDITAAPDAFWTPGGTPAVFKQISPTQLQITFAQPYPVVIDRMGRSLFGSDVEFGPIAPKHYLQKWHIKYNADADAVAKQEGFDNWQAAFQHHAFPVNYFDPQKPTIWAWYPEQVAADRVVAVRNPYFHQVDPQGNQLPYIDRIECAITGTNDVQTLKASSGELDFEAYYLSLKDVQVLKQNQDKGNYKVLLPNALDTSALAFMPNRTVKDQVLLDLFNKLDFRIALSISINRKAINDTLFFGLATPFPALPLPSNSYFKPEWATLHIEYDPDHANQLLDGLGLTNKDSAGFRMRPDGSGRISMLVEDAATGPSEAICELVKADWAKVGLEIVIKVVQYDLYHQHLQANDTQIGVWNVGRADRFGRANPLWFGFDEPSQQHWAAQWALWFQTSGKQGIEPPADIKAEKALFDKFRQALPGTPAYDQLGAQYFDYFANQVPMIATVGMAPTPMVVSNKLNNVPNQNIFWGSSTNFYDPYVPTQWYIKA
jgi:peptide/nickel transport system substrate-binding protein